MKIEIKHRFSGKIIFAHEAENNTIKITVEAAVKAKVSLAYSDLSYAVLSYAVLSYADLRYADLRYTDLSYADLRYAVLRYAVLRYTDLRYATLDKGEKILDSERPFFELGTIGSAARYFHAFLTDKGIRLRAGCFFGSVAEFKAKLKETHAGNVHEKEYTLALKLIELHFKLWPAKTK
jgi:hypothetical protein